MLFILPERGRNQFYPSFLVCTCLYGENKVRERRNTLSVESMGKLLRSNQKIVMNIDEYLMKELTL